jgi:RNA-directed DNA polymerase
MIPKPGQPGKHRPLGIPTVRDRVVQAALKHILEPIFEADFYPCSYSFRPGTGVHAALEELRKLLLPKKIKNGTEVVHRFPYQWAIEGDIKGCFDNISHHGLMNRVRRRVLDTKVTRLVVAFLKAGILSEDQFLRSESGTPQGGVLSPLLANIALSVIDERYERTVWPRRARAQGLRRPEILRRAAWNRRNAKQRGGLVLVPVRYADDFIVLVGAQHGPNQWERAEEAAHQEKVALAKMLKDELGLELSEAKTKVTKVTDPLRFLGHHVRVQRHPYYGWCSKTVIPKDRSQKLRHAIKAHFSNSTRSFTLQERLEKLNPVLRGWGNFYRHAWGAKDVFAYLDHYLWWTIKRWLTKKHERRPMKWFRARYGWRKPGGKTLRWQDGDVRPFELVSLRVERFRHAWLTPPDFAQGVYGEPGA